MYDYAYVITLGGIQGLPWGKLGERFDGRTVPWKRRLVAGGGGRHSTGVQHSAVLHLLLPGSNSLTRKVGKHKFSQLSSQG